MNILFGFWLDQSCVKIVRKVNNKQELNPWYPKTTKWTKTLSTSQQYHSPPGKSGRQKGGGCMWQRELDTPYRKQNIRFNQRRKLWLRKGNAIFWLSFWSEWGKRTCIIRKCQPSVVTPLFRRKPGNRLSTMCSSTWKTRARKMATSFKGLHETQADIKWMLDEGEVGERSSIRANQANSANASRPTRLRMASNHSQSTTKSIVLDKRTTTFV